MAFWRSSIGVVTTVTVLLLSVPASAQQFINVLTGGTSGVYYPVGVALSQIFNDKIANSKPQVQATKASVENLQLLQQGRGEIAFTLGDALKDAWDGNEEVGFKAKLAKLRAISSIYPNFVQIVASKESGIKTLADLKGKRLSVGAPKSGTELNARAVLKAAGITYADLGKVEYLPFAESVDLMKNRQLDATLQSAGLGVSSIRDLATSVDIVVVEIPAEIVAKIGAPYVVDTIPAGTYRGQDAPVKTTAIGNLLVTHDGVPEAVVYEMTKQIYENLDRVHSSHASAKTMTLQNARQGIPIPLHPGAERYFKEKGVN